jgi:hypothetical protein
MVVLIDALRKRRVVLGRRFSALRASCVEIVEDAPL